MTQIQADREKAKLDRESKEKIAAEERRNKKEVQAQSDFAAMQREKTKGKFGLGTTALRSAAGLVPTLMAGFNDPKWYGSEKQLKLAASIPFANRYSNPIRLAKNQYFRGNDVCPGAIGVIGLAPFVGDTTAINAVISKIWIDIRKKVTNSVTYEPSDVGAVIFAGADLVAAVATAYRVLGILSNAQAYNGLTPQDLVRACGWNYSDITVNEIDMRRWLHNYWMRVSQVIKVPKQFTLFARKWHLFSQIFKTNNSDVKSGFYIYNPTYTLTYDSNGNLSPYMVSIVKSDGKLTNLSQSKTWPSYNAGFVSGSVGWTFATFKLFMEGLLDNLTLSTDFITISGHIERAYDKDLVKLVDLPDYWKVTPVYNETELTNIENAVFHGVPGYALEATPSDPNLGPQIDVDYRQIVTTNTKLVSNMRLYLDGPVGHYGDVVQKVPMPILVNTHVDTPDPGYLFDVTRNAFCTGEEVVESLTIWDNMAASPIAATKYSVPTSCGTEIPVAFMALLPVSTNYADYTRNAALIPHIYYENLSTATTAAIEYAEVDLHFNGWMPIFGCGTASSNVFTLSSMLHSRFENVALIENKDMDFINYQATCGLVGLTE